MQMAEYLRLQEKIVNSDGYIANGLIEAFIKSYSVLYHNYQLFVDFFNMLRKPENILKMYSEDNKQEFKRIEIEFLANLTNFLSSMNMLIDHARRFVSAYPNKCKFVIDYNKKIDEYFKGSTQHIFLKNLRNYCLHRALPLAEFEWSFSGTSLFENNIIKLNLDKLLEFEGFNESTRQYLVEMGDIIIEDIIEEYMETITNFYKWFFDELSILHREDIENANALIRKLNDGESNSNN